MTTSGRRGFFKTMGAGAAGLGLSSPLAMAAQSVSSKSLQPGNQQLYIGDDIAVAETTNGKVRGYILRDIYYFLGIPYGADTSGVNRFMPPKKPDPWNDIYPAVWWGNSAPQRMENRYANKYNTFRDQWNYDDVSEDCLRINVFTPGYTDGKKRPVLLWMHGGQMINGNGIEQNGYHGENLARFGDVVFCSVNHRLGPFGFTDFSAIGGEKYADSGNVGMLDLVAALEWIQDNIANFGGDPGNVTIMGQSGGGGKVCASCGMPAARGKFHKAVVLSGSNVKLPEQDLPHRLAGYILQEAGLTRLQLDRLQELTWQQYNEIALKAASRLSTETGSSAGNILRAHVDGNHLPTHPFYPEASPNAAEVPMIICSLTNETSPSYLDPELEDVTLQDVKEMLTGESRGRMLSGLTAEKAEEVVDAYATAFPDIKPVNLWSMMDNGRQRAIALADAKSTQQPPVFNAWFGWQPPLMDGRMKAFHCVDICFWLYNTDLMLSHTGGGARPRELSSRMAGYLTRFMRTGDPNGEGLPQWPRYSTEKGEMMYLDDVCEAQNDPDRDARATLPSNEG